ncbi:YiiX/YebB-like N1pC/P60 family cysteine hydrolase [Gilliamella sp. wkB112]|uniref:YiiX/YebB-like N1pC/P60 family cysteine hydrolase n=1 Tax=Gilliamella sp. wkB112 TaxID=3120257 RepID=UPI00080E2791|nr:YiiX/YebB-like N1pC/P60 family cysteine hydrolase [Gilliamella apicola]OCG00472.1 hypothetical protein A9G12_05120 [Gilliamella apicola]
MLKSNVLNKGDIIFQSLKEKCAFNDAVSHSGAMANMDEIITHINHVGLCVGNNKIIHACQKEGVILQPVTDFLSSGSYNIIASIDNPLLIKQALTRVMSYLGLPYNYSFHPDAKGLYCSQLITYAFKLKDNSDYFQLYPMNFKDLKTQQILPYWITYYRKLRQPIPQGVLGSHPQQLLRQTHLFKTIRLFATQ